MLAPLLRHFRRQPVQRVYLRQLYFSGVQSLWVSVIAGAALGAVVISLVQGNFAQSGYTAMNVLLVVILKEAAPLIIALLFSARSASALATEMATMSVSGEIRSLIRQGISPREYLLWPRIIAAAFSCTLLYIYFSVAAVLAGMMVVSHADFDAQWRSVAEHTELTLLLIGALKSLSFGALIAWLATRTGLQAQGALTEVPRLASLAVLHAVIAVFICDAIILLVI